MGAVKTMLLRSGTCLLSLAAGLVVAELYVRGADVGPPPRPLLRGSILRPSADRELGLENRPGAVLTMTRRDRAGDPTEVIEHRVNALGWRGPLPGRDRGARPRIACVGDSQVFGLGVAEQDTYPAQLDRALEGRAEVLNFGVFDYRALEKRRLTERILVEYAPDLVLMELYIWESSRGQQRLARMMVRDSRTRWLRPGRPGPMAWVRERSALADFLATALFRRAWLSNWVRAHEDAVLSRGDDWDAFCGEVLRARDAARSAGSDFALVFFPMLYRSEGELVSLGLGRSVARFADRHRIPCLDLHAAFAAERDLEGLRVHPEDYHYAREAQGIAAAATAEFLARSGLLETAPAPADRPSYPVSRSAPTIEVNGSPSGVSASQVHSKVP